MLKTILYPGITDAKAIRDTLRAEADKVMQDEIFYKDLDADEIADYRAEVSESLIKINQIKQDIKTYTSMKNEQKKALEKKLGEALHAVQTGQVRVTGTLYLIADHEARTMGSYDESGKLVSSRPLKPEERQPTIMSVTRQHRAANDMDY